MSTSGKIPTQLNLFYPADDPRRHFVMGQGESVLDGQRNLLSWLAVRNGGTYKEEVEHGKAFLKLDGKGEIVKPPVQEFLKVVSQFYDQKDSLTGHAARSCFSSCCAMMVKTVWPHLLGNGVNADDDYLKRVLAIGDTVNSVDQLAALGQYGVDAYFSKDLDFRHLENQLRQGIPVPIGVLHHGHVSRPTGGGHYILVWGMDEKYLYCHDPYGEIDLVNGGWSNQGLGSGNAVRYSRRNVGPRWRVNGTGGWGMIAKKKLVKKG